MRQLLSFRQKQSRVTDHAWIVPQKPILNSRSARVPTALRPRVSLTSRVSFRIHSVWRHTRTLEPCVPHTRTDRSPTRDRCLKRTGQDFWRGGGFRSISLADSIRRSCLADRQSRFTPMAALVTALKNCGKNSIIANKRPSVTGLFAYYISTKFNQMVKWGTG